MGSSLSYITPEFVPGVNETLRVVFSSCCCIGLEKAESFVASLRRGLLKKKCVIRLFPCFPRGRSEVDDHVTGGILTRTKERNELTVVSAFRAQGSVFLFVIAFWDFRILYLISWNSLRASLGKAFSALDSCG